MEIKENNIGQNIKRKRVECGLTQLELSKQLGVSRSAVSSWEVNRNEPSIADFERMASLFGCLKSDLIGASGAEWYFISSSEEKALIDQYRKADKETRHMVARLLGYDDVLDRLIDSRSPKETSFKTDKDLKRIEE